jgi:hypothetical protein
MDIVMCLLAAEGRKSSVVMRDGGTCKLSESARVGGVESSLDFTSMSR